MYGPFSARILLKQWSMMGISQGHCDGIYNFIEVDIALVNSFFSGFFLYTCVGYIFIGMFVV